ncbi:MAG TPA: ABC transporter permease [Fimbriimonas sp.]
MNGFWSVVLKEAMHLRRDPVTIIISLVLPIFQLIVFGYAINFDVRHIPTAVVDQDRSRESRSYISELRNTHYLDIDTPAASAEEAAALMRSGKVRAAVIIPPDFGRKASPQVGVLIDGSDSQVAMRARMAFVRPAANVGPQAQMNVLFNPDMRTSTFMIPALVGLLMQLVTVALTSFSIVREREQGSLEQLMVSPVGRLALMLGKMVPYAVLAFLDLMLILAFGWLFFDVSVRGSLIGLMVLSLPFLLSTLSLGLLISTVSQNQAQALQYSFLTMMPAVLMSGFMFPRETMPGALFLLSEAMPLTHYLNIVRGIVVRGASALDVLPSALALLLLGSLLTAVSTLRFRKSVG